MPIDRTVDTTGIEVPTDYERATDAELIGRLCYVRDRSIDLIIEKLKKGDKLKGSSALAELLDRITKQLEATEKTAPKQDEDGRPRLSWNYDGNCLDDPVGNMLDSFNAAIEGGDTWSRALEDSSIGRIHKNKLMKLYSTIKETEGTNEHGKQ